MSIELMCSAILGDPEAAKGELDNGADVSYSQERIWAVSARLRRHEMGREMLLRMMSHDPYHPDSEYSRTWSVLLAAMMFGNDQVADLLIECGADPNFQEEHGGAPLLIAPRLGKSDLVEKLLNNGAEPNMAVRHSGTSLDWTTGLTPLMYAAGLGQAGGFLGKLGTVEFALDEAVKDEDDDPEQHFEQFKPVLDELIAAGADPNMTAEDGTSALIMAAHNGWEYAVDTLLDAGARVEGEAEFIGTPLMAALPDYIGIANKLIDCGADVNQTDRFGSSPLSKVFWPLRRTMRPLFRAKSIKDSDWNEFDPAAFYLLIGKGADPNQRCGSDEQTVLFNAVEHNNTKAIDLLVTKGAEVDSRDKHGRTPLMMAAYLGHPEALTSLLEAGADFTLRSSQGNTALMAANVQNRSARMIERLDSIPPIPRDKRIDETLAKLKELRDKIGDSPNIRDLPDFEKRSAEFKGTLRDSLITACQKEDLGRKRVIKVLRGAGAKE